MSRRPDVGVTPGGLRVISEPIPGLRSVAIGAWIGVGSRFERQSEAGISHFLEHMLFKGSLELPASEINREFDDIGAKYNAFTSHEATVYYGAVLPEFQGRLLRLLTTMMRPALREADFDVEKKVILEEIQMYEDRPQMVVFDALRPRYFRGHPLGNSVLGTLESIGALERDRMLDYFGRRYAPNNLLLAVAGNYDWDALLASVGEMTAGWPPADAGRERPPFVAEPSVGLIESARFNRAHLALMAPGYAVQDERRHAAAVLGTIVGDDEGSRLYWALVDNGLAETASLGHDAEDGAGHFAAYAATDPARAQEVLDVLRRTLAEAQDGGVSEDELERAKRKLAVSLVLRAETPYGRLFPLGFEVLENGHYLSLQETVDLVQEVTLRDVQMILAERPFDTLTVLGLGPMPALD